MSFQSTSPPLRERREDIPLLVQHFVAALFPAHEPKHRKHPQARDGCSGQLRWPGNIRELENVIERAVILSSGPELKVPVGELSRLAPACRWLEAADSGRGRTGTYSGHSEEDSMGACRTEWGSDTAGIESLDLAIPNEEARHCAARTVIRDSRTANAVGTRLDDHQCGLNAR